MHALIVGLTVFGLIFVGEIPDKTAIAALVLGARYRAGLVIAGAWSAFTVHVVLAVVAGGLIASAPRKPVELVTSVLFLIGAVVLFRSPAETMAAEERDALAAREVRGSLGVVAAAFGIVLVAEFGDVTQILTATLAARYDSPVAVGIGALLALWSVSLLATLFGHTLLRIVPLQRVQQVAALALLVLALVSGISALR